MKVSSLIEQNFGKNRDPNDRHRLLPQVKLNITESMYFQIGHLSLVLELINNDKLNLNMCSVVN